MYLPVPVTEFLKEFPRGMDSVVITDALIERYGLDIDLDDYYQVSEEGRALLGAMDDIPNNQTQFQVCGEIQDAGGKPCPHYARYSDDKCGYHTTTNQLKVEQ